jgi:DHA1 family bicyclomycin/chloramphenicol resistance-like MFS transporter
VQGLGAAVLMAVPRAVVRDLFTGPEATRLMATIMLVISVSPMLAPLAGSLVAMAAGWRAIFAVLCLSAVLSLVLVRFALPETLPPERRERVDVGFLLRGTRTLLTDRTFVGLTLVGGFGMASFFVFLASASFVYAADFGLGPMQFSIAFAANAIGFFAATQMAASFGQRFGMARTVTTACAGFAALSALLFVVALTGLANLWVTVGMLFLANACLGLVIPTVMVMALDPHGRIAGLASSLGGTMQMLVGGLMITAAGPFFDGTVVPMTGAIALCGVLTWLTARAVLSRRRDAVVTS